MFFEYGRNATLRQWTTKTQYVPATKTLAATPDHKTATAEMVANRQCGTNANRKFSQKRIGYE